MGNRDVFISHSTKDAAIAADLCARLEKMGLQCWIAPRNVAAGASYGEEIIRGIEESVLVLLILSEHSNKSDAVRNEIERAFSKEKLVLPLRIRNVLPSKKLEFFISTKQWVDAYASPIEDRVEYIAAVVHAAQGKRPVPTPEPQRQGAGAFLELWLERTLRHRLLASVVAVAVLAAIGLAGLAMQGATQVAVTGATVRVEKAAQGIEAASKSVGTINAKLDDVNSNLKDVKRETSSDPRKELANRGMPWEADGMLDAAIRGDLDNLRLYIDGGMQFQSALKSSQQSLPYLLVMYSGVAKDRLPMWNLLIASRQVDPNELCSSKSVLGTALWDRTASRRMEIAERVGLVKKTRPPTEYWMPNLDQESKRSWDRLEDQKWKNKNRDAVNRIDVEATILAYAVWAKDAELVQALVKAGARSDAKVRYRSGDYGDSAKKVIAEVPLADEVAWVNDPSLLEIFRK